MFFARHNRKVYFNPRSPHGERPKRQWGRLNLQKFQSTLPARGATLYVGGEYYITYGNFNPRSPHGERRELILD